MLPLSKVCSARMRNTWTAVLGATIRLDLEGCEPSGPVSSRSIRDCHHYREKQLPTTRPIRDVLQRFVWIKPRNQVPRTCLVRLPITGVHPRWSHHHRPGAGVDPRDLRSLPVSSLSVSGSRHFPYTSDCRVEASDLARRG